MGSVVRHVVITQLVRDKCREPTVQCTALCWVEPTCWSCATKGLLFAHVKMQIINPTAGGAIRAFLGVTPFHQSF